MRKEIPISKTREKKNEYQRKYRERNIEEVRRRANLRNTNPEVKRKNKEYKNLPHVKLIQEKWKKSNPEKLSFLNAKRRACKLKATPPWESEDDFFLIQEIYHLARLRTLSYGFKWQVDHIVPLLNPTVCGLHVWWNLQVIPASTNAAKGNKHNPDVDWVKEVTGC